MKGITSYATALALASTLACSTQAKMPEVLRPARNYAQQTPTLIEDVERRMEELEKPVLDRAKSIELKDEFFDLLRDANLSHSLQTTYGTLSAAFDDTLKLSAGSEDYIADFGPDHSYLIISVEKIIRNKDGTVKGMQDVIEMADENIGCRTYVPSVRRNFIPRNAKPDPKENTSVFPFELEPEVYDGNDVFSTPPFSEGPICTGKFLAAVEYMVAALRETRDTR